MAALTARAALWLTLAAALLTLAAVGVGRALPRAQVAYLATDFDGTDLYLADIPTRTQVRLTRDHMFKNWLAWSPDGTRLAYFATGSGLQLQLTLFDMAERHTRHLITGETLGSPLTWSADGTELIYVGPLQSFRDTSIVARNVRTGAVRTLVPPRPSNALLGVSADGAWVAYSHQTEVGDFRLYVARTDDAGDAVEVGSGGFVAWGPRGATLAFVAFDGVQEQLTVWTPEGARTLNRPDVVNIRNLAWSADGDALYVVAFAAGVPGLHRIDAGTGALRTVYVSGSGFVDAPAVSPDGRWVSVTANTIVGGGDDVLLVPAFGGAPQRLTFNPLRDWSAAWRPNR